MSRVLDRAARVQDRARGGARGYDGRVIQRGGERDTCNGEERGTPPTAAFVASHVQQQTE
jgi:hypothetical protein